MRSLGEVVTLLSLIVLMGIAAAGWVGFMAAIAIKVARWFL